MLEPDLAWVSPPPPSFTPPSLSANTLPVVLTGPTNGTAQVFTIKQTDSTKAKIQDERKRDHSWFIAYAPAQDPKIAVAVLVENGGFGAEVAAPIARKVLDAYLLGPQPPTDQKEPVVAPKPLAMLRTQPSVPDHPAATDAPPGPL